MPKLINFTSLFLLALLPGAMASAQTACGKAHPETGTFVCYPAAPSGSSDTPVPSIFHLSAQANAPDGQMIDQYWVSLDERRIFEQRLISPQQQLSIELNLTAPVTEGTHTLRVTAAGVGSAELKGVRFHSFAGVDRCNPESVGQTHACALMRTGAVLTWTVPAKDASAAAYLRLFERNLASIEADTGDAAAVDAQGNLYVANHVFADIELRKYDRNGSVIYARILPACGEGFLSVAGLSVNDAGRVWIAANTSACFGGTERAWRREAGDSGELRGLILQVDTALPGSAPPVYITYLANGQNRVAAIRADQAGIVYVAGEAECQAFPRRAAWAAASKTKAGSAGSCGFVAALAADGSKLLWSGALPGVAPRSLALDEAGDVYFAGETADGMLVGMLSGDGERLTYAAQFGRLGAVHALATSADGKRMWLAGQAQEQDFLMTIEPCRSKEADSEAVATKSETSAATALDAFAKSAPPPTARRGRSIQASVEVAMTCR